MIKRARTLRDFQTIRTLHMEAYSGGLAEIPEFTGAWWILYKQHTPVAFAGIHPSTRFCKTTYLCRVAVDYNHRGHGYQKDLIQVREQWARKEGFDWMVTDTNPDTPASCNSLINCGYKLWRPEYRWSGYEPALYWKKKL